MCYCDPQNHLVKALHCLEFEIRQLICDFFLDSPTGLLDSTSEITSLNEQMDLLLPLTPAPNSTSKACSFEGAPSLAKKVCSLQPGKNSLRIGRFRTAPMERN